MTFSQKVKAEMCRIPVECRCCALSELYGMLLYCNTFGQNSIRLVTESGNFVERIKLLLKELFDMEFDSVVLPENKRGKYILSIVNADKLSVIFETFGRSPEKEIALHLNLGVFEDECCYRSFIRGAFLSGGTVMNPEKKYHLELVTSHASLSRETCAMLLDMGLIPKTVVRKSNYVIYFKASESIEDFLSLSGAQLSAIELMGAKVEKDFRNTINRKVNCETANLTKTVDASREQCAALERIKEQIGFENLPEKLRETAGMRLMHPEASLSELAQMLDPPVGKSGLNHRLRKLMEIAEKLPKSRKEERA